MSSIQQIIGGLHQDHRGKVAFVNDFDMTPVKRFYQITHHDIDVIRGWQGHQKESKWFFCTQGRFIINCVAFNADTIQRGTEIVEGFDLQDSNPVVLYVPFGYATAFKATEPNSNLLVYSDFSVSESQADDFRFDINVWQFKI